MLIGAHTPSQYPLIEAEARHADLVQIFLSNPQGWKKPSPRADAAELRDSPIPIYVHAPYSDQRVRRQQSGPDSEPEDPSGHL
jgi:deoxyribonuclease IV